MIQKLFRVSVDVPLKVWERLSLTETYERHISDATKGSIEWGTVQDSKPLPNVYAVFDDLGKAQRCERILLDTMYRMSATMLVVYGETEE